MDMNPDLHTAELVNIEDSGCRSLNRWFYVFLALFLVGWSLMFTVYWQWCIVALIFTFPVGWLVWWWRKNRTHCDLNHVLTHFCKGFWVMSLVAILLQTFVLFLVLLIFFYIFYLVFGTGSAVVPILVITYVVIEEYLKLYFAIDTRREIQDVSNVTKAHVLGSTANALGYATFQGLLWLFIICIDMDQRRGGSVDIGALFLAGFIIGLIGMPMHLLTGYLIGLELTRRTLTKRVIPAVPCVFRSVYLILLAITFIMTNVSVLALCFCLLIILVEYGVLIWYIKTVEKTMPSDYLRRVGQLNLFGYGVLPDGPDDDISMGEEVHDNQIQISTYSMDQFKAQNEEEDVELGDGYGQQELERVVLPSTDTVEQAQVGEEHDQFGEGSNTVSEELSRTVSDGTDDVR